MAIEKFKKTINGVEYQTEQFDAVSAWKMNLKISKIIAPFLTSKQKLDATKVLIESLDESHIDLFISIFAKTSVKDKILDVEFWSQHFVNKVQEQIEVATWILEMNSFFGLKTIGALLA